MFLGSKVWPVHEANNLTAICEPIVYTIWDPQHFTTLSACYRDSFSALAKFHLGNLLEGRKTNFFLFNFPLYLQLYQYIQNVL
jgi:hypothetical protein